MIQTKCKIATAVLVVGLIVVGASAVPQPVKRDQEKGEKAPDARDISCETSGKYIGGLDRSYRLTIRGPKEKTWAYQFTISPPGLKGDIKAEGTYEMVEDLAVFTGKANDEEIRFGLNFGVAGKQVEFNGFFPESDDVLRHHRKWFRKADGKWKPAEELVLSLPRQAPTGDTWKVRLKGERVRWDEAGKMTREMIDSEVVYQRVEKRPLFRLSEPAPGTRIPPTLIPVLADKRPEAVLFVGEANNGTRGFLRGFHPSLARAAEDR